MQTEERPKHLPTMRPVLFAAVGPLAAQAVAELPRVAARFHIRVTGPFGSVIVKYAAGGSDDGFVFAFDCDPLDNLRIPERRSLDGQVLCLSDRQEVLRELTSLTRRLRPDRARISPAASPRIRISAYVLIDLLQPFAVRDGITLAELLLKADPTMDITGLALTGRTAGPYEVSDSSTTKSRTHVPPEVPGPGNDAACIEGATQAEATRPASPPADGAGETPDGPGSDASPTQRAAQTPTPDPTTRAVPTVESHDASMAIESWYPAFSDLVRRLQGQTSFHRLYVIDGRDTNNTWLQTPEEMHRLAAEFLLHHGLSTYRDHLRRAERTRITSGEDFLEVCGSFCCRTLYSKAEVVIRAVAERVAGVDLVELDQRMISKSREDAVKERARKLAEQIIRIYQSTASAGGPGASAITAQQERATAEQRRTEVAQALHSALVDVCEERPIGSLRCFLDELRPLLRQMVFCSDLHDRVLRRYLVVDRIIEHKKHTYDRGVDCILAHATIGQDFTVSYPTPSSTRISLPTSYAWFATGAGLLLLAVFVPVALLLRWATPPDSLWSVSIAGLLVIGSPAIMAWPSMSYKHYYQQVPYENRESPRVRPVPYRRLSPSWAWQFAVALLLVGLFPLLWFCAAELQSFRMPASIPGQVPPAVWVLPQIASGTLALVGLALQIWYVRRRKEEGHTAVETLPEVAPVVRWRWWIPGLACVAAAWVAVVFALGGYLPRSFATAAPGATAHRISMDPRVTRHSPQQYLAATTQSVTRASDAPEDLLDALPPDSSSALNVQAWPTMSDSRSYLLLLGLLFVAGGTVVARWPWRGEKALFDVLPPPPETLKPLDLPPRRTPELVGQISRFDPWIRRLLAHTDPKQAYRLVWPETPPTGTILECLVDDWDGRLADMFRTWVRDTYGHTILELARSSQLWADYLVAEIDKPTIGLSDPALLFARVTVERWYAHWRFSDLLAHLKPDPQRFELFLTHVCAPRWPPTRNPPQVDASVIAVGEKMWEIIAPLGNTRGSHRILRVDWPDPESMVVIRIVQGLHGGWHSFEPLPSKSKLHCVEPPFTAASWTPQSPL